MSSSNCCFLTCIQVSQEAGQVVWYSHLFQNFSQFIVIHIVKGFGIANKAEIDVFLELSCFFDEAVTYTGKSCQVSVSPFPYISVSYMWKKLLKNHLMWRTDSVENPDAVKDWRQEEKGSTEDEVVGWHHQLKGHESEQSPGVGEEQGSLAWRSPWGRKESNMTEWLNWTEPKGSLTCWLQWVCIISPLFYGLGHVSCYRCMVLLLSKSAWFCC